MLVGPAILRSLVFPLMADKSTVQFIPRTAQLHCSGCGDRIPLSRSTMRNQERIMEELGMARELHAGCGDAGSQDKAITERVWREMFIRQRYSERRPDRLAWSV